MDITLIRGLNCTNLKRIIVHVDGEGLRNDCGGGSGEASVHSGRGG